MHEVTNELCTYVMLKCAKEQTNCDSVAYLGRYFSTRFSTDRTFFNEKNSSPELFWDYCY